MFRYTVHKKIYIDIYIYILSFYIVSIMDCESYPKLHELHLSLYVHFIRFTQYGKKSKKVNIVVLPNVSLPFFVVART